MDSMINLSAILLTISALFAYINYRFIGLPTTIGVMIIAMLSSLIVSLLDIMGFEGMRDFAQSLLSHIDFNTTFALFLLFLNQIKSCDIR